MRGARRGLPLLVIAFLFGVAVFVAIRRDAGTGTGAAATTTAQRPTAATTIRSGTAVASPPQLPSDLGLVTLVTKDRALSASYVPPDLVPISAEFSSSQEMQRLRKPAAEALTRMLVDARQQGVMIKVNSAYRSYEYQAANLRSEIAQFGCAQALVQVAAPGHSEHQLGLAADLTSADVSWDLKDSFGDMLEGRWLATHAAAYGFVLSYPLNKELTTGYIYEPWHYRYVTPPVASALVASGKTSTEFLRSLGSAATTNVEETRPSVAGTLADCH